MHKLLIEFVCVLLLTYVMLVIPLPLVIGLAYTLVLILTQNMNNTFFNPVMTVVANARGSLSSVDTMQLLGIQFVAGLVGYEIYKRVHV